MDTYYSDMPVAELIARATHDLGAALELARRGWVRQYQAGKLGAWQKVA